MGNPKKKLRPTSAKASRTKTAAPRRQDLHEYPLEQRIHVEPQVFDSLVQPLGDNGDKKKKAGKVRLPADEDPEGNNMNLVGKEVPLPLALAKLEADLKKMRLWKKAEN